MALSDILGAALPAAGMMIGGPAGASIGALAGGLVQGGAANKTMRQWDKMDQAIPQVDPQQAAFLSKVQQQERQYRAGTDPSSALANRLAQSSGAQTQTNLVRAGGPGIIQNLLSSQNVTQRNLAQTGALAARNADALLGLQGGLIDSMSQRRYDRQRYRRDLALMQGQQQRQDANNQMMSAIPLLGQVNVEGFKLPRIGTGINRAANQAPQKMELIQTPVVTSPLPTPQLQY